MPEENDIIDVPAKKKTEVPGAVFEQATELDLEAVHDIPLEIMVVLGKTSMSVSDLLKIGTGTVIELEKKVGEPVEVFINGRMVAKGEVVIVEDNIGITMTEIIKIED